MGTLLNVLFTIIGALIAIILIAIYLFYSTASSGSSYGSIGPFSIYLGMNAIEYYIFHRPVYSYGNTPSRILSMSGLSGNQQALDAMIANLSGNVVAVQQPMPVIPSTCRDRGEVMLAAYKSSLRGTHPNEIIISNVVDLPPGGGDLMIQRCAADILVKTDTNEGKYKYQFSFDRANNVTEFGTM